VSARYQASFPCQIHLDCEYHAGRYLPISVWRSLAWILDFKRDHHVLRFFSNGITPETVALLRILTPAPVPVPISSRLALYTTDRSSLHESIIDTIGKTPIIKLQRMAPKAVNVYVKLECDNPGGSLKDRLAYGVVEWAEKQ
jgi:hypothetical protein